VLLPVGRIIAIEVVVPVADPEFLVEAGLVAANVGNPAAFLVAHVENMAVVLNVGIEADRSVRAVKGEGHVRELFPSLRLQAQARKSNLNYCSRAWHLIRTLCSTVFSVQTYAAAETRFLFSLSARFWFSIIQYSVCTDKIKIINSMVVATVFSSPVINHR
jgi:hypothetical protein